MLDYLLNQYSADSSIVAFPLWNSEHLSFILRGVFHEFWPEGIEIVLKGKTALHLFSAMTYR
jgi:hypothetical protein